MRVSEQVSIGSVWISAWEELLEPFLLFRPLAFFLLPLLLLFLKSLPKILCGLNEGCLWLLPLLLMTLQLLLNITQSSHKGVVLVFLLVQLSSGFLRLLQQRGFLLLPAEALSLQQILCLFQDRCNLPGFHSVFLKLGLMGSLSILLLQLQSLLQVFYGLNEGCLFLPPPKTMAVHASQSSHKVVALVFLLIELSHTENSGFLHLLQQRGFLLLPPEALGLQQILCLFQGRCDLPGFHCVFLKLDGKPELYPQPCCCRVFTSSMAWMKDVFSKSWPITTRWRSLNWSILYLHIGRSD